MLGTLGQPPSNVKDAAGGKSFTFITIVIRNGMGTLLAAAVALLQSRRAKPGAYCVLLTTPLWPQALSHSQPRPNRAEP
jgi:hypothetical protein